MRLDLRVEALNDFCQGLLTSGPLREEEEGKQKSESIPLKSALGLMGTVYPEYVPRQRPLQTHPYPRVWKNPSLFSPIQHRPRRVLLAFISRVLFCSLSILT